MAKKSNTSEAVETPKEHVSDPIPSKYENGLKSLKANPLIQQDQLIVMTKKYWIGTRGDSPYQNLTIHGVGFVLFKGALLPEPDGTFHPATKEKGDVLELTDEKVKMVIDKISHTIVVGRSLYDTRDERWKKMTGVSLGKFLYMVELCGGEPFGFREKFPEAMA